MFAKRGMVGRLSLLLVGTAIGILLCEALVVLFDLGPRFYVIFREHIQPSENPRLKYELRSGAPDGYFRISPGGLRDRGFPEASPDGVFRVAAIGDSVTYGGGVEQLATWPKQLEVLMNDGRARGADVEVINFGVPGYNVRQIAERMRVLGLRYEPDLIVYGYVLNDPQEFSREVVALRSLARQRQARRGRLERLLSHSRLFLMARHLAGARGEAEPPPRPVLAPDPAYQGIKRDPLGGYFRSLHKEQAGSRLLASGLDELAELSAASDVPIALAIFPLFLDVASSYPLSDVHEIVARAAAERGMPVLDLAPVYARASRRSELYADFLHPNSLGHREAAKAIWVWLCQGELVPAQACSGGSQPGYLMSSPGQGVRPALNRPAPAASTSSAVIARPPTERVGAPGGAGSGT